MKWVSITTFSVTKVIILTFHQLMGKEKLQIDLSQLERLIKSVDRPYLSENKKSSIKNNLLYQLKNKDSDRLPSSLQGIVNHIRELVKQMDLGVARRVLVKERIFSLIEDTSQKRMFVSNFFAFHKKLVSATLLIAMFFGMFTFVNMDTNIVRAETFTTLDSYSGDVLIERDGQKVDVSRGMLLSENDKVVTGENGFATINYFDDSVSRISNNSELIVSKLLKSKKSSIDSYVEISLISGMVWSKVINLVGKNSSFVVKANDVSAASQKAAFNVELNEDKVEIEVFNRSVNVEKAGNTNKVVSGQKAVVNGSVEVHVLNDEEKKVSWVQENLNDDKQYTLDVEEKLLIAKMESLGVDPDKVNFEQSLKDKTVLFLTFNDVDKSKKELDLAEKNFMAAEIKLSNPDLSEEEKSEVYTVLDEFSSKVKGFYNLVDEVSASDKEYAKELKGYVDEKLLALKKDLSVVSSDSPSYKLKNDVDDLLVLAAEDESEVAVMKLDSTLDKLSEAKEVKALSEENLTDDTTSTSNTVVDVVDENQGDVKEAVDIIASIDDSKLDVKEELIDKASEYFTLLNTVEDVPKDEQTIELEQQVTEMAANIEELRVQGEGEELVENTNLEGVPALETATQPDDAKMYGVKVVGDKPLPPGL